MEENISEAGKRILYSQMKDLINQNVTVFPLPTKKGKWSDKGEPGNSNFILDDNIQVKWRKNGKAFSCSGAELKQWMKAKYGINTVVYSHNEPDFFPFADKEIGIVKLKNMPINRGESFALANAYVAKILSQKYEKRVTVKEIRQIMRERELTWHECADRKTMIAIPTRINAVFTHMGGIGVEKGWRAIKAVWKKYPSNFVLQRENKGRFISSKQLQKVIANRKMQYKRALRRIK
ncbi:MAG: HNH endonuclease [Lachnospiraceae bacterium]